MNASSEPPATPSKRANKRLKVGRACYTCRAKKIKCDGLRPCMQCKARQRPCSFYKDGSLELDQQDHVENQAETNHINESLGINALAVDDRPDTVARRPIASSSPSSSTAVAAAISNPTLLDQSEGHDGGSTNDDDGRIFFTDTTAANHNKLKRRGPLMESRISNTLSSLGENLRKMSAVDGGRLAEKLLDSTDTFGSFIMWMPEPSLPSRYTGSIEMPSRQIQISLIDQFFSERHESLALIPRHYFYQQLETKGLLITPLLLNIIYAHAARFVTLPDCPKTEVFYHRARRLVDDFMDVPRVSTIVALYLLSIYEPSPAIYRPGAHHCRQWQYSGMACRMALELGLYNDSNIHSSITSTEVEVRRRVFWGCYELDKFHSRGWERPWMLSYSIIKTAPPSPLPEESEEERLILTSFISRLRFMSIVEDYLLLSCACRSFQTNHACTIFYGIHKDDMLTNMTDTQAKFQHWLRSLSPELQWTPITTMSVKDVLELPAPRPMVGNIHLAYNTTYLELLTQLPSNSVTQFQSRVTAACMTQLAYHLCQKPSFVVKFDFLIHALIFAIKTHLRYLDDPDIGLAQQAWALFDRSIWCMQLISNYAVIPNCTKFLHQVQSIYGLQATPANRDRSKDGNNTTTSISPKAYQMDLSKNYHNNQYMKQSPPLSQQQRGAQPPDNQNKGPTSMPSLSNSNDTSNNQFSDNMNRMPTYLADWPVNQGLNQEHSISATPQSAPSTASSGQQDNANKVRLRRSSELQHKQPLSPLPLPPQQQQQQQHQHQNQHHQHHQHHQHQQHQQHQQQQSSMMYLDNRYQFPPHDRSNSGTLQVQNNFNKSPPITNSSLWPDHQQPNTTGNSIEHHQYNMNTKYGSNREEVGNVLGYGAGDIVVPSQLLTDESADSSTIYPPPASHPPALQTRPLSSSALSSSPSNSATCYAQQVNPSRPISASNATTDVNNMQWQDSSRGAHDMGGKEFQM